MAGGGDIHIQSSPEQARGGRREHQKAWLPLDVIAAIAARSDAATLVRCAATCRDARRRIADDPNFRGLRLRQSDRFLFPLLRGHLMSIPNYDEYGRSHLYLVDTTAAGADGSSRLTKATFGPRKTSRGLVPMDSRRGLLLVGMPGTACHPKELRVCNPATGRSQTLPPATVPPFSAEYVLLVGDGETGDGVGRPFRVLRATLLLSPYHHSRHLWIQTFSSEHGAWSRGTKIPTPNIHASNYNCARLRHRPLVVDDVVHWLCLTDTGSYVLMLHVGAARVNETVLPASFPRGGELEYLLATTSAPGGNPAVLVADDERISAWVQSKHTKKWNLHPQTVIENMEVLRSLELDAAKLFAWRTWTKVNVELVWFAERSGAVLIRIAGCDLLILLDMHSRKIVRRLSDRHVASGTPYCPIEMDFLSWVPTFDSTFPF